MEKFPPLTGFEPGTSPVPSPVSERDSLTVRALACHAADPGSNPAGGDDFFK